MSSSDGPMSGYTLKQLYDALDSKYPSDRRIAGFEMSLRLHAVLPLLEKALEIVQRDKEEKAIRQAIALVNGQRS